MKKIKAFTLVEVIVGIALLGIMSVGFLGALTSSFRYLNLTKELTRTAFEAQEDMEESIQITREEIAAGSVTMQTITAFEDVEINFYQLENTFDNRTYYTLVSDTRPHEFSQLRMSYVGVLPQYESVTTKYLYGVDIAKLTGEFTNDNTNPDDAAAFMMNVHDWYVSSPGFNIPIPSGNGGSFNYLDEVEEYELGFRYPVYPYDYSVVGSNTSATLNNVEDFLGRQMIFTTTPGAKSGRIGITGVSKPVFIMGLPVTSNLFVHFDASIIDRYNTTETYNETHVNRWYDASSSIGVAAPTQYTASTTSRPLLTNTNPDSGFIGKYVEFLSATKLSFTDNATSNQPLYALAVVKGNDAETVFQHGGQQMVVSNMPENEIENGWVLLEMEYTPNNGVIVMGDDSIQLAELIIFNAAISNEDRLSVKEYLNDKYSTVMITNSVVSLNNVTHEVYQGTTYTPPNSVLADMLYGPDKYVPVTWNGTVDTNTQGTYVLEGTAVVDNTKKMQLTVNVLPPIVPTSITLDQESANLYIGGTIQLNADIEPDNSNDMSVTWSVSPTGVVTVVEGLVTAQTVGTATVTATSSNGLTDTCTITVTEQVLKEWTFNSSAEGWTDNNFNSFGATSGILSGVSTSNNNAYITSSDNLGVGLNGTEKIVIRFRNNSSSTQFRLQFATNASTSFGNSKQVDKSTIANNSNYVDLTFDMNGVNNWSGTLKRLRLYPIRGTNSGTFYIDSIKIIR